MNGEGEGHHLNPPGGILTSPWFSNLVKLAKPLGQRTLESGGQREVSEHRSEPPIVEAEVRGWSEVSE